MPNDKIGLKGETGSTGQGAKFDNGKVRLDLIDPQFELSMGNVLTKGAEVHGEYSWQTLPNAEIRYLAALKRHTNAIARGELIDPSSGEFHAAHVAVNAMFLEHFQRQRRANPSYIIRDLQIPK